MKSSFFYFENSVKKFNTGKSLHKFLFLYKGKSVLLFIFPVRFLSLVVRFLLSCVLVFIRVWKRGKQKSVLRVCAVSARVYVCLL